MKKILFVILLFISFIKVNALTINKIYIDAEIDISGGIRIRELVTVTNQKEDIKLNIFYKDGNAKKFNKTKEGLYNSSLYNGYKVVLYYSGLLKEDANISDYTKDDFYDTSVEPLELKTKDDGKYLNIFLNDSDRETKTYYLDYTVIGVAVEHNDVAELYYRFFDDFRYNVESISVVTSLPAYTETFKVWAHGNKNAKVSVDNNSSIVHSEITNYKKGTYLDNRILYDLDLFSINLDENKKSKMDATKLIEEIENERLNNLDKTNSLKYIFLISLGVLILILVSFGVFKLFKKRKRKVL